MLYEVITGAALWHARIDLECALEHRTAFDEPLRRELQDAAARAQQVVVGLGVDLGTVITSYSIHYTKLYESCSAAARAGSASSIRPARPRSRGRSRAAPARGFSPSARCRAARRSRNNFV